MRLGRNGRVHRAQTLRPSRAVKIGTKLGGAILSAFFCTVFTAQISFFLCADFVRFLEHFFSRSQGLFRGFLNRCTLFVWALGLSRGVLCAIDVKVLEVLHHLI
jgi:hypothetical protein